MYVGWLNHMTVSRCKHISYCGWAHPQICCDTSGSSQLLVVQCGTGTVCSHCSTSQCHVVSSADGSSSSNDDGVCPLLSWESVNYRIL